MGKKLLHELAANDGTITFVRGDSSGTSGNMLILTGTDGWKYWYLHINNDTPGTDDGKNPAAWRFAPGIQVGTKVKKGQFIAYMGDSGQAETTDPHLHFELHRPNDTFIDPYTSLRISQGLAANGLCRVPTSPPTNQNTAAGRGFWTLDSDGKVMSFGSVRTYGTVPAPGALNAWVGIGPTASGNGYWVVDMLGHVHAYGDAVFYGQASNLRLKAPVLSIAVTPSGRGYWLLAKDGGIFSLRRRALLRFDGCNAPEPAGDLDVVDRVGQRLLARRERRWHVHVRRRTLLRLDRRAEAERADHVDDRDPERHRLLARSVTTASSTASATRSTTARSGTSAGVRRPVALGIARTNTGAGYWTLVTDGRVLWFGDAKFYGGPASTKQRVVALAAAR